MLQRQQGKEEAKGYDVRVIFTARKKWISRIIRKILRSPVSHVYIEYSSVLWGGRWAAEATTHGGVRKVISSRARHDVVASFSCMFNPVDGLRAVRCYFGERYDYLGAGLLGIVSLFMHWFGLKIHHPLVSSRSQFCSEFVCRFFMESHLPDTESWEPELSSPGRLYNYCMRHPELFLPID